MIESFTDICCCGRTKCRWGRVINACSLLHTRIIYISDTGGIIGKIPTWIFYVLTETFDYVISYNLLFYIYFQYRNINIIHLNFEIVMYIFNVIIHSMTSTYKGICYLWFFATWISQSFKPIMIMIINVQTFYI